MPPTVHGWVALAVSVASLVGSLLYVGVSVGRQTEQLEHLRATVNELRQDVKATRMDLEGARVEQLRLWANHERESRMTP